MEIKKNTKPKDILKIFRECKDTEQVNFKTSWGYIYLAGGILSKLQNNEQSIAIKGTLTRYSSRKLSTIAVSTSQYSGNVGHIISSWTLKGITRQGSMPTG